MTQVNGATVPVPLKAGTYGSALMVETPNEALFVAHPGAEIPARLTTRQGRAVVESPRAQALEAQT